MNEKKAREIQMKMIDVLAKERVDCLVGYTILQDLTKVYEEYLKQEEDIDIKALKKQYKDIQSGKTKTKPLEDLKI